MKKKKSKLSTFASSFLSIFSPHFIADAMLLFISFGFILLYTLQDAYVHKWWVLWKLHCEWHLAISILVVALNCDMQRLHLVLANLYHFVCKRPSPPFLSLPLSLPLSYTLHLFIFILLREVGKVGDKNLVP